MLFEMVNFKYKREDPMEVLQVFFLCVFILGQFKEEMVSGEGFSDF